MNRREMLRLLGGGAIWPLAAHAQQKAKPVVGFLSSRSPNESAANVAAFRQGLKDAGYVDGENVAIDYRWAEGRYDRLPALAAELVGLQVAVIVATGGNAPGLAAKTATARIPIVFITGHGDIPMGIGAMKRGAADFLPKPFRDDELLTAVARALARSAKDCQQRVEVVESRRRLAKLTPREFEVFRLVIAGRLNKEIGAELDVTLRTIKTHRARVMQKIGVISVAELVRLAQKAGVAPAEHV